MDIKRYVMLPHRFRWGGIGGDDCMTFCASWFQKVTGDDPAADLRGTYSSYREAHEIMESFGGEEAFMARHLEPLGAYRTVDLKDGDIGLVSMLAGEDVQSMKMSLVGAVRYGPMWASIAPRGVICRYAPHVCAWRLPDV